MNKVWRALILAAIFFALTGPAHAAKIRFKFHSLNGPTMNVYVSRPTGLAPDRPVAFVMHGVNRNADEVRDQWHELALEHDFLVVVPEFSRTNFAGSKGYFPGNGFDQDGKQGPPAAWTWSVVEAIFDDLEQRFGMTAETYSMYGHSAGARFIQRLIFHVPQARVSQLVVANAGWYMMPDFNADYPYGLSGSMVSDDQLKKALQMPVTVLLGSLDTDPEHPSLRRTPEAADQGDHHLARGMTFFEAGREAARQLDVPFDWRLFQVPGADHDSRLMAPAAVDYLLGETGN